MMGDRTTQVLLSFASKELVHAHLPIEFGHDAKYAQCLTLLRAYLPGDLKTSLPALSLDDLVLSIEAADLHIPLVILLTTLHPTDAIAFARQVLEFHEAHPTYPSTRITTLETMVYTLVLFATSYASDLAKLIQADLERLHCNNVSCLLLTRPLAVLKTTTAAAATDDDNDAAEATRLEVSTEQQARLPHLAARLVHTMQSPLPQVMSTSILHDLPSLVLALATTATSLCDHVACTPLTLHVVERDNLALEEASPVPSPLSTADLKSKDHSAVNDNDDDWFDLPVAPAVQTHRTFARLMAASSPWSPADISWLQSYLDGLDNLKVLSLHVRCLLHQTPATLPAAVADVHALFNVTTPETPPHRFLRLAPWARDTLVQLSLAHGLHAPETRPLLLDVLAVVVLDGDAVARDLVDAIHASPIPPPPPTVVAWIRLLVARRLTSLDTICAQLVVPWIQLNAEHGWAVAHALVVDTTAIERATRRTLLELAVDALAAQWTNPSDASRLDLLLPLVRSLAHRQDPSEERLVVDVNADIRLHVLLDPARSTFSWTARAATASLTMRDAVSVLWGALYGSTVCVDALTNLVMTRDDATWPSAVVYLVNQVAPTTTAAECATLMFTYLPLLLPEEDGNASPTLRLVSDADASIVVPWTPSRRALDWFVQGLVFAADVLSVRHVIWAIEAVLNEDMSPETALFCFGRVAVTLNHAALTATMVEQLKMQCRALVQRIHAVHNRSTTRVATDNDAAGVIVSRPDSFAWTYLADCTDEIHDTIVRHDVRRIVNQRV
ncbi:Aste57867_10967 [Aphanomyces stellatus]|uniref:Aste57867_10967 protein n=1 Tax=Aphanomyces stellatus TaxID=120398 RepID=A0A485KRU5_9STRA|nr:hypothetical protein As57867_010927 [Aphanomyces stellatus]VFT87835.1 Aste57867_10967 [Aphanomyces stellatus]